MVPISPRQSRVNPRHQLGGCHGSATERDQCTPDLPLVPTAPPGALWPNPATNGQFRHVSENSRAEPSQDFAETAGTRGRFPDFWKSEGGIPAALQFGGTTRRGSMRTLTSLVATAALLGGVTIATAQQSGSPNQPAGPKAGGATVPNAPVTTSRAPTVQPRKPAPPPTGSGSPNAPAGPGAGGAKPPGR